MHSLISRALIARRLEHAHAALRQILDWIDSLPFDMDELGQIAAAASRRQSAAVRIEAHLTSRLRRMRPPCARSHSGRVGLNGEGSPSSPAASSVHTSCVGLWRTPAASSFVCTSDVISRYALPAHASSGEAVVGVTGPWICRV